MPPRPTPVKKSAPSASATKASVKAKPSTKPKPSKKAAKTAAKNPGVLPAAPLTKSLTLVEQVRNAVIGKNLSINGAAKAIGVTPTSLQGVVHNGAEPNRRTRRRYLAWIRGGSTVEPVGRKPAARTSTARKPAARTSTARKPGRKATATARIPAVELAGLTKLTLRQVLTLALQGQAKQVEPATPSIVNDGLAQRVHAASKAQRAVIATVLTGLSSR